MKRTRSLTIAAVAAATLACVPQGRDGHGLRVPDPLAPLPRDPTHPRVAWARGHRGSPLVTSLGGAGACGSAGAQPLRPPPR